MNIKNPFLEEGSEFLGCLIIIVFELLKFGSVYIATWGISHLHSSLFTHTKDVSIVSIIDLSHQIAIVLILLFFLCSLGRKLWDLFKEYNKLSE